MHAMWQNYTIGNAIATWVWSNCEVCVTFLSGSGNNNNKRRQRLKTENMKHTERNEQKFTLHTHTHDVYMFYALCAILNAIARFPARVCARLYVCSVCCLHFFTLVFFSSHFAILPLSEQQKWIHVYVRLQWIMWGFGHCVKPRHRNAILHTIFLRVASLHVQWLLLLPFFTFPHASSQLFRAGCCCFFSYFFDDVVVAP